MAAGVVVAAGTLTWGGGAAQREAAPARLDVAVAAPTSRGPVGPAAERGPGEEHSPAGASRGAVPPPAAADVSRDQAPSRSTGSTRSSADRAVAALGVAAPARGAVQPRVESLPYDASTASPVVECVDGSPEQVGCVQLETRPGESSIHVAIRDHTRLPIRAWIRQDVDRDGDFDGDWHEICAQTDRPVPVQPGAIINISLETGRCGTEGRSVPTSGLVTVSLFGQR